MTFKEALQKLGIEQYAERIMKSNSHGELFHLLQYIEIATTLDDVSWFAEWFEHLVKHAEEEEWGRPESVFQHVSAIIVSLGDMEEKPSN